ncbi:9633_t:CDS:2, partial [Acaulospora colombiana]
YNSIFSHLTTADLVSASRLIRNITLCRINLTFQYKLTLANECRNLNSIAFIKCKNLDPKFLKDLARANTLSLEKFCIWGDCVPGNNSVDKTTSTEITDDLLTPMLEFCGNLRELRVCGAEITDDFLTSLASTMNDQVSSPSSSTGDETSSSTYMENYIASIEDPTCNDSSSSSTYSTSSRNSTGNTETTKPSTMPSICGACTGHNHNFQTKSDNQDNTRGSMFLDISQDALSMDDVTSYTHITCPHLTTLDLTECFNLTAFGVAELFSPQQLPKFQVLILQYNPRNDIDLEFFEFLADNFKSHVFIVNVINSNKLNGKNKALQTFARINKNLDILVKKKNN